MRAFNVKTNTEEVNRQKGDGGVRNHGINNVMACEAERSKEEKERLHTSDTFSASDHAPELVVFIQESDYLSVKDIFIDSVVPSQGVLSYKDIYSNEIQQDFQGYVRKQHALDKLMKDGEADHLDGRDGHLLFKSTEKIIPGMQRVKEFQVGDSISLNLKERSASESIDDNSHFSEDSSNNDAECGSTIHYSESSLTTMSSLEEFSEGPECQQPHQTESLSRTEYRMSRSLTSPSKSFVRELAYGDYDHFAVSPLSGPIPDSGSGPGISLRSTSSNASSHSFAFPILPSEWNGSPARMAKADQRQLRKHQSWRACFLCCKF